jgi:hypothetical protein
MKSFRDLVGHLEPVSLGVFVCDLNIVPAHEFGVPQLSWACACARRGDLTVHHVNAPAFVSSTMP